LPRPATEIFNWLEYKKAKLTLTLNAVFLKIPLWNVLSLLYSPALQFIMSFFKKYAVFAPFHYSDCFRGIGIVCLIYCLTSNIFAFDPIGSCHIDSCFSPFQSGTGLNLFDKNAFFGDNLHERFFGKDEIPFRFQAMNEKNFPFQPNFSESLNRDEPSTSFDQESPLFRGQKISDTPPTWDFSFPTFRSFQRSSDVNKNDFEFHPGETYSIACFRRSKLELLKIQSDIENFYSRSNFENILLGLGVHAVISNTAIDQNFRDWYQGHVRSSSGDKLSSGFVNMGNGLWTIPPVVAISCLYYGDKITDQFHFFESPVGSFLGEFSSRTTRALLVGTPTLLLGQILVGAGRPDSPPYQSYWAPFQHSNGISGHAFIGAMPFITLAQMSDNFWLKVLFYVCSTFTAWSRVNDDKHYLSQAVMGWYLSYLSCRAVSKTEYKLLPRGLTVFPMMDTNTVGLGLVYQW